MIRTSDMKIPGMELLAQSNGCSVYQIKNDNGSGTMTTYEVFPGVLLIFNDFHMRYCDSGFHPKEDMLCIDHCREGRLEYLIEKDAYSYVQAGDLKIDKRLNHDGRFFLPLSHYHGITVTFYMKEAVKSLGKEIQDYCIDIEKIGDKFCADNKPFVLHNAPSIEHIFAELYSVPEKIKIPYFKIKILELLLYLEAIELPEPQKEQPYFYKSQVEKIKSMQKMMTENLGFHYTLEYLTEQYDISLTALKDCFKHVYGYPVNTYMRIYRMNRAAVFLKQDKSASVTEIAGRVGYDSPSKFAAAFKAVIGKPPLEYRKGNFQSRFRNK